MLVFVANLRTSLIAFSWPHLAWSTPRRFPRSCQMSSISFSLVSCIVFLPHFFCILHPLMPHCTVSCLLCTSLRFCLLVCFPVIRLVPVLFSLHTCHSYFLTAPSGPLPCYHSVYSCLLIYCFLAYPSPCLPSLLLAVVFCCMAPRPICFQASHCPCAFVS